jgi:hypothetical protein
MQGIKSVVLENYLLKLFASIPPGYGDITMPEDELKNVITKVAGYAYALGSKETLENLKSKF